MTTKEQGFSDFIEPNQELIKNFDIKKYKKTDNEPKLKILTYTNEQQNRKDKASWAMHLAMVKMAIVQPKKTHKVEVRGATQNGKPYHYTYKYADLADVDKAIMDAIKKTAEDGKPIFTYYFDIDNGAEGVTVETVIVDAATGFSVRTN